MVEAYIAFEKPMNGFEEWIWKLCTGTVSERGVRGLRVFWWLSFKHGRVGISRYLSHEDAVVIHQKQLLPCPRLPLCRTNARQPGASSLLQLLLGAELVGVTALLLAAVGGTGRVTSLVRKVRFPSSLVACACASVVWRKLT